MNALFLHTILMLHLCITSFPLVQLMQSFVKVLVSLLYSFRRRLSSLPAKSLDCMAVGRVHPILPDQSH
jgi:hypothetical protein